MFLGHFERSHEDGKVLGAPEVSGAKMWSHMQREGRVVTC